MFSHKQQKLLHNFDYNMKQLNNILLSYIIGRFCMKTDIYMHFT